MGASGDFTTYIQHRWLIKAPSYEDWGTGGDYIIHTTGTFYNKSNDFLMINISAPKYHAEGYATSFATLSVGTSAGDKTRIDDILSRWGKKDCRIDTNKG